MLYKLDDKLPGCRLSQEEWESKDAQMKKAREVLSEKVAQAEQ